MYEIFPDRFATSGLAVETPEWAIRRDWDELPTGYFPERDAAPGPGRESLDDFPPGCWAPPPPGGATGSGSISR